MARGSSKQQQQKNKKRNRAGDFFMATLVMWAISVVFEIWFNKRSELLPIIAGCFFFQIANWVLRLMVSREPLFLNTSVSLLHSSLASASVVCILLNQWIAKRSLHIFGHEQLVQNTWPWAYPALCFSCGYFAYDQWDMLKYRLYSGWFPSILAHHLILLICFTLALYRNVTINYLILTLICESFWGVVLPRLYQWYQSQPPPFVPIVPWMVTPVLQCSPGARNSLAHSRRGRRIRNVVVCYDPHCKLHSIFLHVRKVRRMAGIRTAESRIVKAEWALNWVTFVFARTLPHILILIKLIWDAPKFSKGIELPLALFGMIGMNLLNVGLGIDLLGAFKREMNPPQNHHTD